MFNVHLLIGREPTNQREYKTPISKNRSPFNVLESNPVLSKDMIHFQRSKIKKTGE